MKRLNGRLIALLLPLALLLSLNVWAAPEDGSAVLPRSRTYTGQFDDIALDDWYYPYVCASYEYGLFEGRGDSFDPRANITIAELLTLSARLRAAYEGDVIPAAAADEAWYAPYVAYLDAKGLLNHELNDFGASATRAQLAGIFVLSLPEGCYDAANALIVTDAYATGSYITDVGPDTPFQPQILWMYRQGLVDGMDDSGSYWPAEPTTRAEVAAVVTRMVDPTLRLKLSWVIPPAWSAAGRTLASLVEAPEEVSTSPAFDDTEAIDNAVRQMLANGEHTLLLQYPYIMDHSGAKALANAFADAIKNYSEQMYNDVICQRYLNSGRVILYFCSADTYLSASRTIDKQYPSMSDSNKDKLIQDLTSDTLERYREETMAKAIEIHDMLWETGQLDKSMSQYDVAKIYFQWLCDHCVYDDAAVNDENSTSHIAYNALVNGLAVCDGYTGAYNLLLKLEGIDCYTQSNDTHIWTVATLDGTTYHIDVTWGDQISFVEWKYFAMDPALSEREHGR